MPRLKLVRHPNEILRKKNEPVTFPLRPEIKELADQMIFACKKFRGVGLAAPQIGKNLQIAIINLEHYEIPAFPIFNPKVLTHARTNSNLEEGCLSMPKKFGMVSRPEKITVAFQNLAGKSVKTELSGLAAKVLQHEIDHLNGILICDKWDPKTVHELNGQARENYRKNRRKLLRAGLKQT
ncbi:MAG: peptide deformylase [Candidatus Doudnabacteria bacterium]|nr:peptide deformylase [Candidatus Doudnabacteria bacterium]